MPHLAPLAWVLGPFVFWFMVLVLMSIMWWNSPSSFPKLF